MSADWSADDDFAEWIERLETEVIQDEYGYEPGEFDVFPELWWSLYLEGISPQAAFERALAALKRAEPKP